MFNWLNYKWRLWCHRPTGPREVFAGRLLHVQTADSFTLEVREDDDFRWLHFGTPAVQSAMWLKDPTSPALIYMPLMMLWQHVLPVREALLLGLGGGGLVRSLHHKWRQRELPSRFSLTAIEISQEVADVAQDFFLLPSEADWPNFSIRIDDAATYLAETKKTFSTIMVDIYMANTLPEATQQQQFYQHCWSRLEPGGVLTVNYCVNHIDELKVCLQALRQCFHQHTLCLPMPGFQNVIVIASRQRHIESIAQRLKAKGAINQICWDTDLGLMANPLA